MNVQISINMALFLQFVYNNWSASAPAPNLDGRDVLDAHGQPIIAAKNYKVLKTIYSNDLATDMSPNKALEGYTTIGILAQNAADPTDVVIAIRGTEGIWEWVQDLKFLPIPFPRVPGSGLTEDGFTDMYLSFSFAPSPSATFFQDLKALLPPNATVTITGHSLGASLATLLALDMSVNASFPIILYTLASPRVGDLSFFNLFNHVVQNTYRIANRLDIVPKTPPPLFYFHVGDETELLPDKTMKFDLGCEHALTSYLNMLGAQIPGANPYMIDSDCLL